RLPYGRRRVVARQPAQAFGVLDQLAVGGFGARCTDVRTGASLANLVVDPHARLASFTCSARKPAPPPRMALGPA
ncbi:hypothetical protein, partial [Bordetella pertussis]|uniref:hypothetical protein n=1 Tax=Bordetella pertussis TaxID=520 RepID=UPI001ADD902B